jgi:hypothetical protein
MGNALCHLVITNGIDVTTILKLGRTAIPAALRCALDERDATCVVPFVRHEAPCIREWVRGPPLRTVAAVR